MLVVALFAIAFPCYAQFFTPPTWRWSEPNLQVGIHRSFPDPASAMEVGSSYGAGFGWSKWSLFPFDRWRGIIGDSPKHTKITAEITGVTGEGVTVRVVNEGHVGNDWFDRTVPVPAHNAVRVNVTNDVYITGEFTQ